GRAAGLRVGLERTDDRPCEESPGLDRVGAEVIRAVRVLPEVAHPLVVLADPADRIPGPGVARVEIGERDVRRCRRARRKTGELCACPWVDDRDRELARSTFPRSNGVSMRRERRCTNRQLNAQ